MKKSLFLLIAAVMLVCTMTVLGSAATEYPDPVIWKFNNPEFVSQWSASGVVEIAYAEEDDVSYIDVDSLEAVDNCNIAWYDIPETSRFELSDYPYMSIRYRSTHSGNIQLYPSTETSENDSASSKLYHQFAMDSTTGEWTTMVIDKFKGKGTWEGVIDYIRIDFMRPTAVKKDIDIDYIAFFPTLEQAQAYAGEVVGEQSKVESAVELIDEEVFSAVYPNIVSEETAKAKLEELIATLELPEDVRTNVYISDYEEELDAETPDNMVGKYNYVISFLHGPLGSSAVSNYEGYLPATPIAELTVLGAQIRKTAPEGIRFGAKLNKAFIADADITNVTYGMAVIPVNLIPDGAELTLDIPNVADVKAKKIFDETDTHIYYTAVIKDIPEELRTTQLAARPYIKYTFVGTDYVIYSKNTKIRSIEDVKDLTYDGYENELDLAGHLTYDIDTWMEPFWKGDTVYHELFWPIMADGAAEDDDLIVNTLYPITDVITVKNGTNTVDYVEGKDFYVNGNGQLVIPAGSAINRMPFSDYIFDTPRSVIYKGKSYDSKKIGTPLAEYAQYVGKYMYFSEGNNIQINHQYSISYRHTETWPEDAINPNEDYEADALPITRQKLENKEAFNMVFYGDSVTAGGNQTGPNGVSPYVPHWRNQAADKLEQIYGYTDTEINVSHRAVGGKTSAWGAHGDNNEAPDEFAKNRFAGDNPTLFVLAFGLNDRNNGDTAKYKSNITSIVNQIHEIYPVCEFLLVSNSMPNPLYETTASRTQYEGVLEEIVTEFRAKGLSIDCAKVQSMHKQILTVKEFRDMSGNNLNHQNDMLSRLYAQTLVAYITNKQ